MEIDGRIVNSLKKMNFINPTEVQEVVIPLILEGKDVTCRAKTGTGKTGAFLIPITQNIIGKSGLKVLVLTPTRELAKQVADVAAKILVGTGLGVTTVYGGASINAQMDALRRRPSFVIGTPGRILDLMSRGALNFSNIEYLVLDEADVMLDMGFIDDIKEIISKTPENRRTSLFSATMPAEILSVARKYMKKERKNVIIGNEEERTVESIRNYYTIADRRQKFGILLAYLKQFNPEKGIIFTNTKVFADRIYTAMRNRKLDVVLLHGGLTQAQRELALRSFRNSARFLVATNVASRGLDIPHISDIINFDAPEEPNVYIHRVGRTARLGANGRAFTILTNMQEDLVSRIENKANIQISQLGLIAEEADDFSRGSNSQRGGRDFRSHDSRPRRSGGSYDHNSKKRRTGAKSYPGYGRSYNDYQ